MRLTNWAGNVCFAPGQFVSPASVSELRDVVSAARRLRVLGTGHSFNDICTTDGVLVSVASLPRVMDLDDATGTVTVSSGTRYGELAPYLHSRGFALRNLGSLPHISVAGACATGTHGSGDGNGALATEVAGLEIVTADGALVQLGPSDVAGAVVSLGTLGVTTHIRLRVVPTFDVRQQVFENVPFTRVLTDFDAVFSSAYSVSLFTDWRTTAFNQAWIKVRDGDRTPSADWMVATPADGPRHPIPGMDPANSTQQMGVPGPWFERLPHFRLAFTPSSGDELQTEYLLPRRHAPAALSALAEIRSVIAPPLQISEIRTVAADELWLSENYQQDSVALHFTWIDDLSAVLPALGAIEQALAPFEPRPHWGKVFTIAPEVVAGRYPRLADFGELRRRYDPSGKFGNAFVDQFLSALPSRSGGAH